MDQVEQSSRDFATRSFDYDKIRNTLNSLKCDFVLEEVYNHVKWSRKHSGCGKQETLSKRMKECKDELLEAAEALESGDIEHLAEETGDVLWDLLFLIVLLEEKGHSLQSIVETRISKQVRRCPHMYEPREDVSFPEELAIWKERKKLEKQGKLTGFGFDFEK